MTIRILLLLLITQFGLAKVNYGIHNMDTIALNYLATLGKTWGLLKYYHPGVAKGKMDWDKFLIFHAMNMKNAKNNSEFNIEIEGLINSAGPLVNKDRKNPHDLPDSLIINLNWSWIDKNNLLIEDNKTKLKSIVMNYSQSKNHYVQAAPATGNPIFKNEKPYIKMKYPDEAHRLLSLFRYWNVINYFYPYRNIIGYDWDSVLNEFIPKFMNAKDSLSYHLTVAELSTKINDTHSGAYSPILSSYFGKYYPPFEVSYVNKNTIITKLLNDSLCQLNGVKIGDVIMEINSKDINQVREKLGKYFSGSNEIAKQYMINLNLLRNNEKHLSITVANGKTTKPLKINLYPRKLILQKDQSRLAGWRVIDKHYAYVDLSKLQPKEIERFFQDNRQKEGIIIDVRSYPKWTLYRLAKKLNKESKEFAILTKPNIKFPGTMKYTKPLKAGKTNKDYYKGKVVVLINEKTFSRGEFTCMALKTAPDITFIGSQTAGADGNVSSLKLPGGITTYFSGLGVFYPDGSQTQKVGIIPNIKVVPTIQGIKNGRDEVLERALEYLKTGR